MSVLKHAFEMARNTSARVVFPEWDAARIAEARHRLEAENFCTPLPVGKITDAQLTALVAERGVKQALARRMLQKPMIRAAAMVAAGEADAMVAGVVTPTRRVIEAASLAIGLAEGVAIPSSSFLVLLPDERAFLFADCAANIAPDAKELAAIALASHATGEALLGSAKVALLSYSTGRSGAGESVDTVRQAARDTGFLGPVQADAALDPVIAKRKKSGSGDANVLVFPSLDAGNIAVKLCVQMAGAQAIGPLLQGFRKPVCDLSRGATVDEIVASTVVTIALGQGRSEPG
jgi:phosphate acetyltransferase